MYQDSRVSFGPGSSTGPTDVVAYGPDGGTEDDHHLLGDLKGKRVLELGCVTAQRSIAFALQGATAIGVDFSPEMIDAAKRLCERERVRVEIRQSDLADLAFLRADSVDLVVSVYALSYGRDVERVFRQATGCSRWVRPWCSACATPCTTCSTTPTRSAPPSWPAPTSTALR